MSRAFFNPAQARTNDIGRESAMAILDTEHLEVLPPSDWEEEHYSDKIRSCRWLSKILPPYHLRADWTVVFWA